jgi:hypothetical protein
LPSITSSTSSTSGNVARPPETRHAIEAKPERCHRRDGFARRIDNILPQARIVADMMEAQMEARRTERLALVPVRVTQIPHQPLDARDSRSVREDREKQPVGQMRGGSNPSGEDCPRITAARGSRARD